MNKYRILAQSFTTSDRIARIVQAVDEAAALRMVTTDLNLTGYYVVGINKYRSA